MKENLKIITLVLILIFGFISYRVSVVPKTHGIKTLKTALKRIDRQINALFGDEVVLRGGVVEHQQLIFQAKKLAEQIPSEKDLPRIMDEVITQSVKGLEIEYETIEPQQILNEGNHKKFPIKISMYGSYYDFIMYLTQLSNLSTIILVDDMKMRVGVEDIARLEIDLVLSAFVMPDDPQEKTSKKKEKTFPSMLINPFAAKEESKVIIPTTQTIIRSETTALKLQGIWKGRKVNAFINGQIVQVGNTIEGHKVIQIKDKKVVLTKGGKQYTLMLK